MHTCACIRGVYECVVRAYVYMGMYMRCGMYECTVCIYVWYVCMYVSVYVWYACMYVGYVIMCGVYVCM